MRSELKRAIELSPTFPESYHLLAFINLVENEQIDESIALLKRGMALSPGREEFSFMLAQLYMHKQDYKSARQILEPLAHGSSADQLMRANAQSLLDSMTRLEEQMARFKERQSELNGGNDGGQSPRLTRRGDPPSGTSQKEDVTEETLSQAGFELPIRKPAAGEEQVLGLLLRIDCDAKGATFVVKVGDQLLKLHAPNFDGIQFTTYTPDVAGAISCGPRKPASKVVVTYRPAKDASAKSGGDAVALDFVPKDFELKK
jgi:tetratricopeptide (TPR) repeat protein